MSEIFEKTMAKIESYAITSKEKNDLEKLSLQALSEIFLNIYLCN
jgi:hypothetical protein